MKESTEGVQTGQTTAMGDALQGAVNGVGVEQSAQKSERFTRTGA